MKNAKILTIAILGLLLSTGIIVTSETINIKDDVSIEYLGAIRIGKIDGGNIELQENYISKDESNKIDLKANDAILLDNKDDGGTPNTFNVNICWWPNLNAWIEHTKPKEKKLHFTVKASGPETLCYIEMVDV